MDICLLQTDRLRMLEREVEALKTQLEHNKKEAHQAEEQYKETMHHWQTKVCLFKIYTCFIFMMLKKLYKTDCLFLLRI